MARKDYRDGTVKETAVLYVEKLNLPNLKRECLKRGLMFERVGNMSVLELQSWFLHNFANKIDLDLINQYDLWVEGYLRERGCDETLISPAMRLGNLDIIENGETKKKRHRSRIPRVREKKARTEEGLYTGTKKAFTFELQKKGLSKAEVLKTVKEKYPDAKEKSIGIWFNKSRRLNKK